MIIVIDGYNLLRAVFYREKGKLLRQRAQLISLLSSYREDKGHEIVLVFDGGHATHALREVHGGVTVIFSGQKRSADDWIIEYIDRTDNQEVMLITRDRQIIDKTRRESVDSLDVVDFYKLVVASAAQKIAHKMSAQTPVGAIEKYEQVSCDMLEGYDSENIDALMIEQSISSVRSKELDSQRASKKKGAAKRRSKKEKRIEQKIRKL